MVRPMFAWFIDTWLTKGFWVVFSMAMLALCTSACAELFPIDDFYGQWIFLSLLNLFSALQDVAVDCLAVRICRDDESVAYASTLQAVAYR